MHERRLSAARKVLWVCSSPQSTWNQTPRLLAWDRVAILANVCPLPRILSGFFCQVRESSGSRFSFFHYLAIWLPAHLSVYRDIMIPWYRAAHTLPILTVLCPLAPNLIWVTSFIGLDVIQQGVLCSSFLKTSVRILWHFDTPYVQMSSTAPSWWVSGFLFHTFTLSHFHTSL